MVSLSGIYLASMIVFLGVMMLFAGIDFIVNKNNSYLMCLGFGGSSRVSWYDIAEKVGPILSAWIPFFNIKQLDLKLTYAGRPFNLTAEGFIGLKFLLLTSAILLGLFFMVFSSLAVLWICKWV